MREALGVSNPGGALEPPEGLLKTLLPARLPPEI